MTNKYQPTSLADAKAMIAAGEHYLKENRLKEVRPGCHLRTTVDTKYVPEGSVFHNVRQANDLSYWLVDWVNGPCSSSDLLFRKTACEWIEPE